MAKVIGLFTIQNEPELRYTPQGKAVINLSLPDNYGLKGDDGKYPTQWYDASLWGKRAEALAQYLTKGKQAFFVLKDVHIETYEGKNGQGYKLVGFVEDIQLTHSGKPSGQNNPAEHHSGAVQQGSPTYHHSVPDGKGGFDDFDDDIPF